MDCPRQGCRRQRAMHAGKRPDPSVWRDLDGARDEVWYLARSMESVEFLVLRAEAARLGKPIIVGETGVHNAYTNRPELTIPDRIGLGTTYLHNHVRALRDAHRMDGVLFWLYGTADMPHDALSYDLNRQPLVRDPFIDVWLTEGSRAAACPR